MSSSFITWFIQAVTISRVQCCTKLYLKTVLPGTPKLIPLPRIKFKGEAIENDTEDGPEQKNEKFYCCENSLFIYFQNRNLHCEGYAAYATS